MFEDLATNKDQRFTQIVENIRKEALQVMLMLLPRCRKIFTEQGIELAVYFGDVQERDNEAILNKLRAESSTAIDRAIEIVRNRVDQYGVSGTNNSEAGKQSHYCVELPGVKNESQVRTLYKERHYCNSNY